VRERVKGEKGRGGERQEAKVKLTSEKRVRVVYVAFRGVGGEAHSSRRRWNSSERVLPSFAFFSLSFLSFSARRLEAARKYSRAYDSDREAARAERQIVGESSDVRRGKTIRKKPHLATCSATVLPMVSGTAA
jgi:hypothetical protein